MFFLSSNVDSQRTQSYIGNPINDRILQRKYRKVHESMQKVHVISEKLETT